MDGGRRLLGKEGERMRGIVGERGGILQGEHALMLWSTVFGFLVLGAGFCGFGVMGTGGARALQLCWLILVGNLVHGAF